jgi:uncharacterized protein
MLIDTRIIPEGHFAQEIAFTNQQLSDDWPRFEEALRCSIISERTGGEIMLTVSFEGTIALDCARCVKPFLQPVRGRVSLIVVHNSLQERFSGTDDEDIIFFDDTDEAVDISSAVHDDILINLPMMPLCSQECTGFEPPQHNRHNEPELPDSRWDALRALRNRNQ